MENCLYQGKTICTFDLKDDKGYYYENIVLDWKQAAADRLLICSECGAQVYLAAGPIKEPYFSHYDLEDCDYGIGHETEELKRGKRLLYQLLNRSFPESDIQARFRMENGLYSTLYCILEDGRSFAVDYRLQNNSLEKFSERDTFYQANKVKPIYVMSTKQEKNTKQIDWYQNLLQNSMGYLIFLDTDHEIVTLKKSFGYRIGNTRKFLHCSKIYPVRDLILDLDGRMICDFTQECEKLEAKIQEEKHQYNRRQEQLKQLQEEKLQLEEEHRRRQEAYHLSKSREESTAATDLNPVILERCRQMIAEGNGHLVSKKYYDAIMKIGTGEEGHHGY